MDGGPSELAFEISYTFRPTIGKKNGISTTTLGSKPAGRRTARPVAGTQFTIAEVHRGLAVDRIEVVDTIPLHCSHAPRELVHGPIPRYQ